MDFDAVVLAGGRGSRLGGVSKAALRRGNRTLLDLALAAAHGARTTVVVGDVPARPGVLVTRESPAYSGPAAAVLAGMDAIDRASAGEGAARSSHTLVLACDVPGAAAAVGTLLEAAAFGASDGVIAVDSDQRDQYLLAIYSSAALREMLRSTDVCDASLREIVGRLSLTRVAVPSGSADDVDTWADADRLGITRQTEDPR